mgnify:CR=1 FL=1
MDDITISVAKKYLPDAKRTIAMLCEIGVFKTAYKKGVGGKTSPWMISRREVMDFKYNRYPCLKP